MGASPNAYVLFDQLPAGNLGNLFRPAQFSEIAITRHRPSVSAPTLSTDATLSDLELEDNNNTDITLTPTFASATTTYTANVVNSVDEITIAPTVNDSNATYEVQNNSGTALTDSDTNTTGFQVELSEGANTIKVEVTAQDASTETYTVTVTRTPADCETDDIWCATLTVGTHTTGGITFYGYNFAIGGNVTGSVSPNTFIYRTATVGIVDLQYDNETPSSLRFDIGRASGVTPSDGILGDDDFTFHVGTQTFAIDAPGVIKSFTFPDHGVSWTVGDTVTVRLVKNRSNDATLSALTVNDGTNDLTLTPTFAPGTTTYTAPVVNSVDEITITPTVNDTTTPATYEIQNNSGTALTDADTGTDGFQVDLSVGANIIKVEVTAEDASTETYTVTVTRAAATGICGRTAQVRDAIVDALSGTCADVTAEDLATFEILDLDAKSITALAAGDFDGMSTLTSLDLGDNTLTTLPNDIFDDLVLLEHLSLSRNNLTTLPNDVFDSLTTLYSLDLASNNLSSLAADVFDELTALETLDINLNDLTTLPAGVFDKLTALTTLDMNDNDLSTLSADVFEKSDRADRAGPGRQRALHAPRRLVRRPALAQYPVAERQRPEHAARRPVRRLDRDDGP